MSTTPKPEGYTPELGPLASKSGYLMDKLDKGESEGDLEAPISPMDTTTTIETTGHTGVAALASTAATTITTSNTKSHAPKHHQPRKSVEGWIVFATGIPAEAESDDIERVFADHGNIHSMHLNVDRRTGYLKGYALVEYYDFKSAQSAIHALNDSMILDQKIKVDWCFLDVKPDHRRGDT